MSKLKFLLPAFLLIGIFTVTSCKKTTNNNIIQKDSVYYSPWMKLSFTFDNTDSFYYATVNASAVTQNVLSTGAVLSYFGEVGVPNAGDTATVDLAYWNSLQFLYPGTIEIDSYYGDLSYTSNFPLLYRYVVIPGSILATTSLQSLTQQQLNKMSFTDVQKALNSGTKQASGNTLTP